MILRKTLCFVAVALMTTATGYAQIGCGCNSDGPKYPSDSHCDRAWTYEDANALWAGYCHQNRRDRDDCGCGLLGGVLGGLGNGCATAGTGCHSRWPSNCDSGDCGQSSCGFGFGNFLHRQRGCGTGCGLNLGGCGGGLLEKLKLNNPCGCGSLLERLKPCGGCDGGPFANLQLGILGRGNCDSGCGNSCWGYGGCDSQCGCGARHGFDLFAGLKSRGVRCGLGRSLGFGSCRGCDSCDGAQTTGSCGCN